MGVELRQTVTAALVALLVGVAALGGLQGRASAVGGAEAQLLSGINSVRSANGVATLAADADLAGLARGWSDRMRSDYEASGDAGSALRHNPSVFDQIPHSYTRAAENVGYHADSGASTAALADRILDGFMSSSGHRGNVLGDFTLAGVGLAQASDGTLFATVVFTDGGPPPEPEPEPQPEPRTQPEPEAERESERESRSADPAPSRDERPEPEPEPDPPPPPPEPLSGEDLFGTGWPEGYLVSGPWALPAHLLLSVPDSLHRFVLGLGTPHRIRSHGTDFPD